MLKLTSLIALGVAFGATTSAFAFDSRFLRDPARDLDRLENSGQTNVYVKNDGDIYTVDASAVSKSADFEKLKRLSVGSHAAFMVVNKGSSLFLGCKIFEKVASDAKLELRDENGKTVRSEPFFDYFYQVEDKKSGMHHPEGMLWISRPGNPAPLAAPKSSVPLTSVAPLLLKLLGLSTTSPQSR
jgi:hypothetical protein